MNGLKELAGVATPLVETACNLIEKLAGRPCEIAGEMLADQLVLWQWQQRIRIFSRAQAIMKTENIAARTIPTGFLLPLLEAAGKIEEDELQTLWSNLIASAAESEKACETSYIETLRGMSRREASLLQVVSRGDLKAKYTQTSSDSERTKSALPKQQLQDLGFDDSAQFWASATRLQSIGILVLEPGQLQRITDEQTRKMIGKGTIISIYFTQYGADFFLRATRTPVQSKAISAPWMQLAATRTVAFEATEMAAAAPNLDQVHDAVREGIGQIPVIDSL